MIHPAEIIQNARRALQQYVRNGKPTLWRQFVIEIIESVRIVNRTDLFSTIIPSLTYTTFMALVPLVAVLFVITGGLGCEKFAESWLRDSLASQPQVSETILTFVNNYLANINTQSNWFFILVGAGFMIWTLWNLMSEIEKAFNSFWEVDGRNILRMMLHYALFFVFLTFVIVITAFLNAFNQNVVTQITENFAVGGTMTNLTARIISATLISVFFSFAYYHMPNAPVRLRHVIVPSIFAGIAMTCLQYVYFNIQSVLTSYNVVYGSFAALPLFLLWLKFSWTICILGAIWSCASQKTARQCT